MADFPAEPWRLRGQLHASVLFVPRADVPLDLPPGWTPVRLGARAVVGLAWVDYQDGGDLTYREVMATVLLRRGVRVLPHVVRIWVDSEASRDGGRALWAIPKELATFQFRGEEYSAWDDSGGIALGRVRRLLRLPGRWPVRFSIVQRRTRTPLVSPVRTRAGLDLAVGTLDADPTGPLGFLAGHRAWLTFTLRDFDMRFGGEPAGNRPASAQWSR